MSRALRLFRGPVDASGFTPETEFLAWPARPAAGAGATTTVAGDLDGDGKTDLVVVDNGDPAAGVVRVFLNTAVPGAAAPTYRLHEAGTFAGGPVSVTIGDVDRDTRPDVVVATRDAQEVTVLLNRAAESGTLGLEVARTVGISGRPVSVSLGDIDGNGWLDVVMNTDSGVGYVLSTVPTGQFDPPLENAPVLFFQDRVESIYVGGEWGYITYRVTGQRYETTFQMGGMTSVHLADVNGDAKADLLFTKAGSDGVFVRYSQSTGQSE